MEDSTTPIPPSLWASLNSWFTSTVFFILLNLMIATIVFTSNLPTNNNNNQQEEDQQKQNEQNQPQIARSPSILHRLKSFNFLPQKPHQETSPETHHHHHQEPIEVTATEFVFNQPIYYQTHFDSDPIHQQNGSETSFDFDPTRIENSGFELDPTREENTGSEFDPTRMEDTGYDFDPTHEEHTDGFESLDEVYSKLKGGAAGHVDRTKSDGELPAAKVAAPTKMKKSESMKKVGFSDFADVEVRRPATVRERKTAVKMAADDDDDDVEVDSRAADFINKFKNDLKLQRIESIIRTKGEKK